MRIRAKLIYAAPLLAFATLSGDAQSDTLQKIQFPNGFKWCVSTAAYQVEGGNTNSDWSDWEEVPGHIRHGDRSGDADDHWNRLEEDTQLIKNIHANAERFSVEWSKIEPSEGVYDQAAIDHYRREIALLDANGIEPIITLSHFTFPKWVAEKGGWEWAGLPPSFAKFTEVVYTQIAPNVKTFITINEPTVLILAAYVAGIYPPGKTGLNSVFTPMVGMLKSHAAAYTTLHQLAAKTGKSVRVGLAHHLRIFDPARAWSPFDIFAAHVFEDLFDWVFVDAVETGRLHLKIPFIANRDMVIEGLAHTEDFIGVNYYSRDIVRFTIKNGFKNVIQREVKRNAEVSDLGWEIYPEGMYRILMSVKNRYPGKSVLITENGIADAKDTKRGKFILDHLQAVEDAMKAGVNVEGYCHWSLMDNFEWDEGFTPRFGLYEVDYATQKRTPRPSASIFSRLATDNQFEWAGDSYRDHRKPRKATSEAIVPAPRTPHENVDEVEWIDDVSQNPDLKCSGEECAKGLH